MAKVGIYCYSCDDVEDDYIIDGDEYKETIDYLSYIECVHTGEEIRLYKNPDELERLIKLTGGETCGIE